jgi:hypothetical protein
MSLRGSRAPRYLKRCGRSNGGSIARKFIIPLPRESGFLGLIPNFVNVTLFEPEQVRGIKPDSRITHVPVLGQSVSTVRKNAVSEACNAAPAAGNTAVNRYPKMKNRNCDAWFSNLAQHVSKMRGRNAPEWMQIPAAEVNRTVIP